MRVASLYRCCPEVDTGFTKADRFEKRGQASFCVYFARGCCTEGVNCRFYHRVPQMEDIPTFEADNMKDVFGRSRHATFKENRTGIGSFAKDCKILVVSRIKFDDSDLETDAPTGKSIPAEFTAKDIVRLVYEQFSPWGEIEDIIFNQSRLFVYIKFRYRVSAEFAREAMQN